MLSLILLVGYLILVVIMLVFSVVFAVYTFFLFISNLKGSPFVPTSSDQTKKILKEAGLKKNQVFLDLGCGDGRTVILADKLYNVKAIGIDVNPVLIALSRLKARFQNSKAIFKVENILETDKIAKADVIYIFLMPNFIDKLKNKLQTAKKGALIISHGFKIGYFDKKLVKTIKDKPFFTYFYRM